MANGIQAELEWVTCEYYQHELRWEDTGLPWVAPSPNLASAYAAYLYPAICWFEPTPVSVGRGTDSAFTLLGASWFIPPLESGSWQAHGLRAVATNFTPLSLPGKSTYPKFQDQMCQGLDFQNEVDGTPLFLAGLELLQEFYQQHQAMGFSESFFKKNFERWPGNRRLAKQISSGKSAEEIYQSWQEQVESFKTVRSKYLLYP